jgi:hypothetical protein
LPVDKIPGPRAAAATPLATAQDQVIFNDQLGVIGAHEEAVRQAILQALGEWRKHIDDPTALSSASTPTHQHLPV